MASYQSAWCGYYPNVIPYIAGQPFGYPYYSPNVTQPVFYSCQTGTNLTTGYNTVNTLPAPHYQLSMNVPSYYYPSLTNQYPQQPVYLPNHSSTPSPQFSHQTMLTTPDNETNFRQKLNNESGCHRVLIQGSRINYVGQHNLTSDQHINWSQVLVEKQPEVEKLIKSASTFVNTNPGFQAIPAQPEKTKATPDSASNPNRADFTNLDLLSSVSLLETSSPPTKIPELIRSKLEERKQSTVSGSVLEDNHPSESNPSLFQASALGLVSLCLTRKPTVWLNVTLQVDTSSAVKSGQPAAQYRSLMTNILTELYFPPKLSLPNHLHSDKMSAIASYDERGRLTVLEVEFITPGIYKVENTSEQKASQRKSTRKPVTLTKQESLEALSSKSQYLILGDLCPVPKTFFKCHRNAQPLQKKISEYLYSREFRKHTLPLLLKNGEADVWTTSLNVPRTRSRVSDYDDLANGDQSLKRKYSNKTLLPRKGIKLTRASSVSSVYSSSPDSSDQSAVNSPCPSPSSSISSLSSYQMSDTFCEDSCDSVLSNLSEPPILTKETTVSEIVTATVMTSPPRLKPVTKSMMTRSKQKRTGKTSNKL